MTKYRYLKIPTILKQEIAFHKIAYGVKVSEGVIGAY